MNTKIVVMGAGSEIALHDINPAALAATEQTAKHYAEQRYIPFTLSVRTPLPHRM
ncbi:TPA: hypothetical protein NO558_004074 [Klebsiella pneumoniae]|nr:hypothetical protein [Klebsiella pneumoniae]HCI5980880.1 hypothetical protein [Klebsiella variicola subsp. variicola]HCI6140635.1 hypothetical protein [Klebsiella variicola subsp. variicola]